MSEYVICGASLEGVCSGEPPPEELVEAINAAFTPDWQATAGYRILPRVLHEGTDEEEDLHEDGTYRELPHSIRIGDAYIAGGVICTACYVTLMILSPSGRGLIHELGPAIVQARGMDPAELPAIR